MIGNLIYRFKIVCVFIGFLSQTVFAGGVDNQYQECPKERGGFCIELYDPVCAIRDTGVRCIKAPCPATENLTFANSCKACSDVKVHGYQLGACPGQADNKTHEEKNDGK